MWGTQVPREHNFLNGIPTWESLVILGQMYAVSQRDSGIWDHLTPLKEAWNCLFFQAQRAAVVLAHGEGQAPLVLTPALPLGIGLSLVPLLNLSFLWNSCLALLCLSLCGEEMRGCFALCPDSRPICEMPGSIGCCLLSGAFQRPCA